MHSRAIVVGAFLLYLSLLQAGEDHWAERATQPVPEGVKVTLELDRQEFFLGENVLVHFVIENAGKEPFTYSEGGDYRAAPRHLRFKVVAKDETGKTMDDPFPDPSCFGGGLHLNKLAPGEKRIHSLELMRYCSILAPGRYTVTATHDFGWKEGERKHPVGETTVVLRMPTPEEAEKFLTRMETLPQNGSGIYGKRMREHAEYSNIRQPIYLEGLLRRVKAGNERAVDGIASIATPAATKALIDVASSDAPAAKDAALQLMSRLPDPEFERKLPARGPWKLDMLEERRQLSAKTWDPAFAPLVRTLALRLVADKDMSLAKAGGFMLQAVGTAEDARPVLDVLNRSLESLVGVQRGPKDDIQSYPPPLSELLRATQVFQTCGFRLGAKPSGNAELLYYFECLAKDRPPRWLEMLETLDPAAPYPIRQAALRSIPQPVPETCVRFVLRGLADGDPGVCNAACEVAGASKNPVFLKPVLEVVGKGTHKDLLHTASMVAHWLGGRYEVLQIWAERMADEAYLHQAVDMLQDVVALDMGSKGLMPDQAGRLEVSALWKAFLTEHAAELKESKRFKIGDPALKAELFNRVRLYYLDGGKTWP